MKNKLEELNISERELEELKRVSKDYESDLNKVLEGYPIQYLIGYINFYGYKINVNNNVLIPRFETELLVEKTIKRINNKFHNKVNVLDIGVGSGAISIAISKEIDSDVTGVDISEEALLVANENSKLNNADIHLFRSNMLDKVNDKYDVIISNPPYISKDEYVMDLVKNNEPSIALYASNNGLYFYEEILKNIKNYLKEKYLIAFEIGCTQADEIKEIAAKYLDNYKIFVEQDYTNRDRYIFIENE